MYICDLFGGEVFKIVPGGTVVGDMNGDGGVSIFDFPSFAYWFGQSVPVAPSYVDFNRDGGISIFPNPGYIITG